MDHSESSDDDYEDDGGGGGGNDAEGGGTVAAPEPASADAESEGELYDIGLAATHSYMSSGMVSVPGRSVLEAGWQGRVPVVAHHGCVFPGETVPMLLPHASDASLLSQAIRQDRLFGLLCPDETGNVISGYGVLCEVFEVFEGAREEADEQGPSSITFKARATHRFRLTRMPKLSLPINAFNRMHFVDVTVLPEISTCDTLSAARLNSLDPLRTPRYLTPRKTEWRVRSMEAAATPWPLFVHEIFDYQRMRNTLHEYFKTIMLDKMPEEPVSLSFWVASNMALSARDRLALFVVDNALLRLHMECRFVKRKSVLCCSGCLTEIARRESIFPMSSEGVHSNYVNLGGYMHDLLTVSAADNVSLSGAPSAEYSWFPGYAWTIATCAACSSHIGWRSTNPFDSDCEIPPSQPSPSVEKKKIRKKVVGKTNKNSVKKIAPAVVKSSFFGSDSETEVDLPAPTKSLKKRKLSDSENEQELGGEPIRAAALRSFLSRRSGSGYTLQRDPTRQGNYYVELRVYNAREAEVLSNDRWKRALVTYKSAVDDSSPVWKAVTKLVTVAKEDYRKIQPILYQSNVF